MAYFTLKTFIQLFSAWEKANLCITQVVMTKKFILRISILFNKLLILNKLIVILELLLYLLLQTSSIQSIMWNLLELGADILNHLAF